MTRHGVTACLAIVMAVAAATAVGSGTAAAVPARPPGGTPCLPDSPTRPSCVSGTLQDGTPYEFVVPARWNGTVVVALDFAGPGRDEPLTARLLADGVARGGTSRAITGWDIRSAIDNQAEALARFEQAYGRARKAIASGTSMGGFVAAGVAQVHPHAFDAAVPMCGGLGGSVRSPPGRAVSSMSGDAKSAVAMPESTCFSHDGRRLDLALEDLAGRALGELVDEPDLARVLVGGDALLDELAQLGRRVASAPALSATAAPTSSPSSSCGIADHGGLAHRGVLVEDLLDLARVDVVAAADDELLLAVDDEEVAVLVDAADVAGAEPAVGVDRLGGRLRAASSSPS